MPRISARKKIIRACDTPMNIAEQMQHHMHEMAKLFDSPKMTLVIRSSTLDMPLVMTNDQPEEAIAAIKKIVTVMAAPAVN